MTEQERRATAEKIYNHFFNILPPLYGRWQDEKEYEAFDAYVALFRRELLPFGATLVKATTKPFGFTYTLADATYKLTTNSRDYKYSRIA